MKNPRQATEREKNDLAYWVADEMGGWEYNDHLDQAHGFVSQAAIAVFDDYVSDGPGYTGKVMTVVWSGGPQMYEAFIWRKGNLVHLNQDPKLIKTKPTTL
jgi:hypothetical protein